MRKTIVSLVMLMGVVSFLVASPKKMGEPLTLTEVTKISEILSNPDKYVGQKVLVEGLVTGVCETRGCWMNLASDKNFEMIQVKVVDGVIVFPMESQGKTARVEGIVQSRGMKSAESYRAKKKSEGEYKEGTGMGDGWHHTKNKYRIQASGAEILD